MSNGDGPSRSTRLHHHLFPFNTYQHHSILPSIGSCAIMVAGNFFDWLEIATGSTPPLILIPIALYPPSITWVNTH